MIGSDGFGFAQRADGTHHKIPQIGGVVIEDDVEIGANTTIDRPAVGETRIGAGTKIDNLVQIAHGVTIGRDVLLAAQVGIAGSTTIEDRVTLAGQVGVAGHLTLGKGVVASAQTGIPNSVEAGAFVSGYPGDRQPRLAQVVGGLPPAAGAQEDARRRSSGVSTTWKHDSSHEPIIEVPMAFAPVVPSARSLRPCSRRPCCWRRSTQAAVRPPRLDYTMTTLPNGLNVVFLEDHSTPIVHLQMWYHVGSKNERPGRTGFAHFFEHMMFKGSKNVEPEGHPSYISSVGGQSNAYTNEDATVFWETVPSQYLPLDPLARGRSHGVAAHRREGVQERARSRQGRAPDADREPALRPAAGDHRRPDVRGASLQAPGHRQHEGPRRRVGRRRARVLPDLLRAEQRDRRAGRRLRSEGSARRWSTQYLGRVPKSDKPVPRDIPKEPAQTKEKRVTLHDEWPLPAVVVAHHITFDGNPDSYPLHIASKILSDGQSSRIYRKLVYEKRHRARGVRRRQHHRGSEPVLRRRDRPAGAHDRGGDERADRRARQAARGAGHARRSCSRRRTSSRATTSSAASRTRTRPSSSATPS